ncbi:MAG: hypothetical protein CMJ83_08560 [Planctomycetes bacterium]|nr:hypothetical protein [Planctomycetota bacterium]
MRHSYILILLLGVLAPAQNKVQIPDDLPAVGPCAGAPWALPASTYVLRIPGSYMDPANRFVEDICFAPCTSGTWSAPNVQIALGHLPPSLPPGGNFSFPYITGGATAFTGSFLDLTVIWDSSVMAGFTWSFTANVWSPMGFAASSGTGFSWNGVDDVGFYVTMANPVGAATMHRSNAEPFQLFNTSVYQAGLPTRRATNGLKISFKLQPGVLQAVSYGNPCNGILPLLSATMPPTIGNTLFTLDVTSGQAGQLTWIFAALAPNPGSSLGGCTLYLDPLTLLALVNNGFSPLGPVFTSGAVAVYPAPIPWIPSLAGQSLYLQAVVADLASPVGFITSNGLQLAFY